MEKKFSPTAIPRSARCVGVLAVVMCFHANAFAQPNRIPHAIDTGGRFALRGNLHPIANGTLDQGRLDASLEPQSAHAGAESFRCSVRRTGSVTVRLAQSSVDHYHKWIIAESYADRFGLSQFDINEIASGLTAGHLTFTSVCSGFLCSSPSKQSFGYNAGTGNDLLTELGSLYVKSFLAAWNN